MIVPGSANPLLLGDAGYNIQRSLRFRSSASAYLSRTFGTPTNQAIWTWSGWVKRGMLGTATTLLATGTGTSDTTRFEVDWSANNTFRMSGGTTIFRESNRVFRDPSAYGHLFIAVDTTQGTASLRARAWWNNEEITWATNNTLTTCGYNTAAISRIGETVTNVLPFDGYLAEVNFIDGQALTPSSFGQTDAVTGVWVPKKYTGTYGTNGFYLPFTQNDTQAHLGYDFSQGISTPALSASAFAGSYSNGSYLLDGNIASSATSSYNSGNNYCGIYFPATTRLQAVDFFGSSGSGMNSDSASNPNTYKLYAKNGAPSSSTDGTLLQTINSTCGVTHVLFNSFTAGDYTHYWFTQSQSATTLYCTEIQYSLTTVCNHWMVNNLSLTSGATYDSMTDVPTLTSATAANFCVWNPLSAQNSTYGAIATITNGNLDCSDTGKSYNTMSFGTMSIPTTGKWYWEVTPTAMGDAKRIGITNTVYNPTDDNSAVNSGYMYYSNGNKFILGSSTAYGATYTTNDVIGVAVDSDASTITFYKNGVSQGNASTSIVMTNTYVPYVFCNDSGANSWVGNFGQRPFSYTPPTGFKALNTFNLPDPTIKKPNQYMDATLWTGNGSSTVTVTNAAGFQPDLVWVKERDIAQDQTLSDSVRGAGYILFSNGTAADYTATTYGQVSSFNSNGFTASKGSDPTYSYYNRNTGTYVGWQWKESATAGFDIVTYTGNGVSGRTVAHNLGVAPKFTIIKQRNSANAWNVWAYANNSGDPDSFGELNGSAAWYQNQGANGPYTVTPSATELTLTAYGQVNGNGNTYVAYLFAEIAGFSKFGSYTGNGDANGVFIYLGFRPKYIMFKRTDTAGFGWHILDTSRNPYNVSSNALYANLSDAEGSTSPYSLVDILSNGIKHRQDGYLNQGTGTYIYAAFAENPFKYANAR